MSTYRPTATLCTLGLTLAAAFPPSSTGSRYARLA